MPSCTASSSRSGRETRGSPAALVQESLDLYRELGNEEEVARAIAELGGIAIAEEDLDTAAARYEEAVPLFREQGHPSRVAAALGNLGTVAHMRRDYPTAVGYYEEAIELAKETGDIDGVAVNFHNLARSELAVAGPARAWRRCARASPSRGGSATGR